MLHAPRTAARATRHPTAAGPIAAPVIPFDYAASFALTGQPGRIVQDAVTISPEGVFVATAIGYSFAEDRGRGVSVAPLPGVPTGALVRPGDVVLGQLPISTLLEGVRINPALRPLFFQSAPAANGGFSVADVTGFSNQDLPAAVLGAGDRGLFQRLKAPDEISFLFSIVDSNTGRELQDEPMHNLASLGRSNGDRPFRQLATPMAFAPRSSIRVQVIERSEGVSGTLQVVFYGYKLLGNSVCPEPVMRALQGPAPCPVESVGAPNERVLPFDAVVRFPLTGDPLNAIERELGLSTEGGFVVTHLGYGLQVEERGVPLVWSQAADIADPQLSAAIAAMTPSAKTPNPPVDLAALPVRLLGPSAWIDGIRIRPEMVRLAVTPNGRLAPGVPADLASRIFERLNQPQDVSFRYAIFDGGRGRELQNRPLHNIAGLGSATGDRPFKRLARALVFLPRSSLRMTVEEHLGRGTLFVTFQGYKILGAAGRNGRRAP